MLINDLISRNHAPVSPAAPSGAFALELASAVSRVARPAAQQTTDLPADAASRVLNLLGLGQADRASLSYEVVNAPQFVETGGVLVQDGQLFAIVNDPRVREHAAIFGLDQARLRLAIAEQEVAQKIIQSNPRFAGVSNAEEEVVGEAAYLNSYPDGAIRTLERSAIFLSEGGEAAYGEIAEVTATALEEALRLTSRVPGAPQISGQQALRAFDAFIQQNTTSFSNSPAPYRAAFDAFSRDVLGVTDPQAFRQVFNRTMQSNFNTAAQRILN